MYVYYIYVYSYAFCYSELRSAKQLRYSFKKISIYSLYSVANYCMSFKYLTKNSLSSVYFNCIVEEELSVNKFVHKPLNMPAYPAAIFMERLRATTIVILR